MKFVVPFILLLITTSSPKTNSMHSEANFETVFFLSATEIDRRFQWEKEDAFPAGLSLNQGPYRYQALKYRMGENQSVYLAQPGGSKIFRFSRAGKILESYEFPVHSVLDFRADVGYLLVLKKVGSDFVLGKWNPERNVLWEQHIPVSTFEGNPGLEVQGGTIALSSHRGSQDVILISWDSGQILGHFKRTGADGRSFLQNQSLLTSVGWLPETNTKTLLEFDLMTGKERHHVVGDEWYGLLNGMIGVDEGGTAYLYGTASASKPLGLVKLDESGKKTGQVDFFGIFPSADLSTVYTAAAIGDTLRVACIQRQEHETTECLVPADAPRDWASRIRFNGLTEDGSFRFDLRGNIPFHEATWTMNQKGILEMGPPKPISTFASMQSSDDWQVNAKGDVFIPVSTEDGWYLVRVCL